MPIDRRALLGSLAVAAAPLPPLDKAAPAPPVPSSETIPLWPNFPPGSPVALPDTRLKRVPAGAHREYQLKGVAMPAIHVYRPAVANGIGLIVMPGGGYAYLSVENEGSRIADWYTRHGYTVFVLNYRLPGEGWTNRADAPLQDAQRAIRIVRARAATWQVDPAKVGVIGFSAGGHAAASLATMAGESLYEAIDAADRLPTRPAFVGLLYAVTTMQPFATHSVSRLNLLGPNPSAALVLRRSPVDHVGKDTPPCFLVHALDDGTVPADCSIDWMAACRKAGVPVEAHLIEHGGHGFGLHLPDTNPGSLWPEMFLRWTNRHIA
ncbi:alpha/beta hydrolase [Sphingomonas abietis]|uniref:Alpha/beta hydrolase n=1 Tax=Sphingomonas abietis TaxID=3012344 RepID=A0ABY7NXN3_9SPHN|nr:alpha/beta hydrolase [Sphingomonas abietis]WBO24141.1 alpha/beta hydrolase [Sphingomonas abietis]